MTRVAASAWDCRRLGHLAGVLVDGELDHHQDEQQQQGRGHDQLGTAAFVIDGSRRSPHVEPAQLPAGPRGTRAPDRIVSRRW